VAGKLISGEGNQEGHARVRGLFIARMAGAPIESCQSIELIAGKGVVGDRYATGAGFWSDARWPDQEITLVEGEVADDLEIDAGALRRNIVTEAVPLTSLIGSTFELGDALLLGVRPCDPCHHLETLTRTGLAQELASRGGLRARILHDGRVSIGDSIRLITANAILEG
jgi:MOSC domain